MQSDWITDVEMRGRKKMSAATGRIVNDGTQNNHEKQGMNRKLFNLRD